MALLYSGAFSLVSGSRSGVKMSSCSRGGRARQVVVGRVVGLDLRDVDGGARLEDLALGQLDLPVHGLARGDGVGVAAGLQQRRGVERAAADDRLARVLRVGAGGQREQGGEERERAPHGCRLRRKVSAPAPANPAAASPPPTSVSTAGLGGSSGVGGAASDSPRLGLLRGLAALAAEHLDRQLRVVRLAAGRVVERLVGVLVELELEVVAAGLGERLAVLGLLADADRPRDDAEPVDVPAASNGVPLADEFWLPGMSKSGVTMSSDMSGP